MKKHIRISAAALLIFSLSGCVDVQIPEASEDNSTQAMSTAISAVEQPASSSESKKSNVPSKAPISPTERPKPAERGKAKQSDSQQDSSAVRSTEPPKQEITTPNPQQKV